MKRLAFGIITLFAAMSLFAARPDPATDIDIPLKNWSVPSAAPLRVAPNAAISSNTSFIAVVPCRAVDTRNINPGALGGGIMADNSSRSFALRTATNCDAIPTSVKAYSVNIAVFGSAPGPTDDFLMAYPTGSAVPNVANLNFVGGQTLSNAAIVPAGTGASIDIYVYRSTHVIIDVNGYFIEPVVTGVTAGAGLSASGTGNVTLSIAPLGVNSSMLAANAVTTGAIQDSAVTATKIANLAVGTAQLADASVTSAKIASKVFANVTTGAQTNTATTCTNAGNLATTIMAPVAGKVVVNVVTTTYINHTNGVANEVDFGWGTSPTACFPPATFLAIPSVLPSGGYFFPVGGTQMFSVAAGSTTTFYFNSIKSGSDVIAVLGSYGAITATFIPD